ncbi:MAG: hypothetical protein ACYCZH_15030 [Sulfuriferula sp.]
MNRVNRSAHEEFITGRKYRQGLVAKYTSPAVSLRCCRKESCWPIVSAAPATIAVKTGITHKAQVAFGLMHADLREEFATYLATLQ